MKKVILAMSGGVDSSVAAYLMQQAGYDVTGVMMRLFDKNEKGTIEFCGKEFQDDNSEDARRVAEKIGADFEIFDMRDEFRSDVIDGFVAAYESGETPNPCVFCNKRLKFEALYNNAIKYLTERGCMDAVGPTDDVKIATGHYVVSEYDEASGRYKLRKAADLTKDQSYFLYALTQEQLARTVFPLGSLTKYEVRRIAEEQGFSTALKKESQDICFIPDGDYAAFIEEYTGCEYPPGDFVDAEGNVMGRHKGIINYTIGQRKGLGLALKKPAYVLSLDAAENRVVLGDNDDLFSRELTARDFNWVSVEPPSGPLRASARIRYRHREAPCEIIPLPEPGRVRIIFDETQRAITRGQSVVVYGDDYVLGGGIIE